MQKSNPKKKIHPAQRQKPPGLEYKMQPEPVFHTASTGSNKLLDNVGVITGGDSGIGRAVAIAFAQEGADTVILYLKEEEKDAEMTQQVIKGNYSRQCILMPCNISDEKACRSVIKKIGEKFKHIDILVNNAGVHYPAGSLEEIKSDLLLKTFSVNILAMFWITRAVLPLMKGGGSIINTTSVTAYRGSAHLIDYSATKGAIVSFTRSLSANLAERKIRVNAVAPGPVWTPLIVSSFTPEHIKTFGTDTPLKRPAQPVEIAPSYVFLASSDAAYITWQVIHHNGGEIVNG